MNNTNFITIQGWMLNELGLKGNELIVYAVIYGFTQDGASRFNGSLSYLAEWTNTTKRSIINTLQSLMEKQLIDREEVNVGGVKKFQYYVKNFHQGSEKFSPGVVKNFHRGSEKISLHNNIEDNINNNIENNNNIDTAADAAADKKYAFKGKVIKLNNEDYERWQKLYPNLNLSAELLQRDIWLDGQPDEVKKKWYISTSQYFIQQDMRRKAQHDALNGKYGSDEQEFEEFLRGSVY